MNIKDIVLRLKNRSIIDIYENNYSNEIDNLYINKFIEKFSHTKEKIEQSTINDSITKENKKIDNKLNLSMKNYLCILSLYVSFITLTVLNKTPPDLTSFFFLLLVSIFFVGVPYSVIRRVKKDFLIDIKTSNNNKLFNNSKQYINNNYKDFYSNVTFELINELNLITEVELQEEKESLKKYLIQRAEHLDQGIDVNNKHETIRDEVTKQMFIDEVKPIKNKLIDKDNIIPNKTTDSNYDAILRKLKIKFYKKTPII